MIFIPHPIIPSRGSKCEPTYGGCEPVSDRGKAEDFALILYRYAKEHGLDFKYRYDKNIPGWDYIFTNPRTNYRWTYHTSVLTEALLNLSPEQVAEMIIGDIPKELF